MPCCAALFVFVFCTHPSLRGLGETEEVVEEEEDESRGCMIGSFVLRRCTDTAVGRVSSCHPSPDLSASDRWIRRVQLGSSSLTFAGFGRLIGWLSGLTGCQWTSVGGSEAQWGGSRHAMELFAFEECS